MKIVGLVFGLLVTALGAANAEQVYWTVEAEYSVLVKKDGTVAINIGSNTPTSPNPSGTNWYPCGGNFIFLHKTADGSTINSKYIDRMLAVALVASNTSSVIRVGIERDASNNCYSSQIFG